MLHIRQPTIADEIVISAGGSGNAENALKAVNGGQRYLARLAAISKRSVIAAELAMRVVARRKHDAFRSQHQEVRPSGAGVSHAGPAATLQTLETLREEGRPLIVAWRSRLRR